MRRLGVRVHLRLLLQGALYVFHRPAMHGAHTRRDSCRPLAGNTRRRRRPSAAPRSKGIHMHAMHPPMRAGRWNTLYSVAHGARGSFSVNRPHPAARWPLQPRKGLHVCRLVDGIPCILWRMALEVPLASIDHYQCEDTCSSIRMSAVCPPYVRRMSATHRTGFRGRLLTGVRPRASTRRPLPVLRRRSVFTRRLRRCRKPRARPAGRRGPPRRPCRGQQRRRRRRVSGHGATARFLLRPPPPPPATPLPPPATPPPPKDPTQGERPCKPCKATPPAARTRPTRSRRGPRRRRCRPPCSPCPTMRRVRRPLHRRAGADPLRRLTLRPACCPAWFGGMGRVRPDADRPRADGAVRKGQLPDHRPLARYGRRATPASAAARGRGAHLGRRRPPKPSRGIAVTQCGRRKRSRRWWRRCWSSRRCSLRWRGRRGSRRRRGT